MWHFWCINVVAGEGALLHGVCCPHDHTLATMQDQCVASADCQLLGAETSRALHAQGFKGKLCRLSANDQEQPFLKAGVDAFMFKPFPCEQEALKLALVKTLRAEEDDEDKAP